MEQPQEKIKSAVKSPTDSIHERQTQQILCLETLETKLRDKYRRHREESRRQLQNKLVDRAEKSEDHAEQTMLNHIPPDPWSVDPSVIGFASWSDGLREASVTILALRYILLHPQNKHQRKYIESIINSQIQEEQQLEDSHIMQREQ